MLPKVFGFPKVFSRVFCEIPKKFMNGGNSGNSKGSGGIAAVVLLLGCWVVRMEE